MNFEFFSLKLVALTILLLVALLRQGRQLGLLLSEMTPNGLSDESFSVDLLLQTVDLSLHLGLFLLVFAIEA